ncbi:MAG: hypothetical protein AB1589_13860 [Cyanobacteriota bacterium]
MSFASNHALDALSVESEGAFFTRVLMRSLGSVWIAAQESIF